MDYQTGERLVSQLTQLSTVSEVYYDPDNGCVCLWLNCDPDNYDLAEPHIEAMSNALNHLGFSVMWNDCSGYYNECLVE